MMQNIRLSSKAAHELLEKLGEFLDDRAEEDVREVCIRAGDDINKPLDEVEVYVTCFASLGLEDK